jgi:MFS family permease
MAVNGETGGGERVSAVVDVAGARGTAEPLAPPEPGAVAGSVLSVPFRALTLGIVSVVLLIAFEATAVGTAMPVAAEELDGVSLYGFAFSAFFTTSLLGMTVSGQWADRRGPTPPLAAGIAAFACGLVTAGTAQVMGVFVLGRAVQGIGGGLVIVALYVAIGRAYPERLRPSAMAAMAASWVVPAIVGPLIAGTVTQQLGWRWVFLGIPVLVVLPLVVMLPALRRMAGGPASAADAAEPLDGRQLRRAAAVAVGAGLLQYAGQDLRPLAVLPAVAGAVLLVPAALRLLPPGTFRARHGLPAVVLLRGIISGSFIVAESFIPLTLVTQRGLSVTLAGLTLAAGGATWALGSWVQARPCLEPRRHGLIRLGMALVTCGIAYCPLVLLPAGPVWTLAAVMAVACFGMGLSLSSSSVLLLKLSAPEEAGENSAALQTSDSLTSIVLLTGTGAAFAALGGGDVDVTQAAGTTTAGHPLAFTVVYLLAAVFAALGIVVAGRLRVRGR